MSARSVSIFCFLLYHYTAKGGIGKSPALQAKRITARQRLDLKAPGRKDHGGDVDKHAKQFPALKVIRLITIAVPADLIFVQLHLKRTHQVCPQNKAPTVPQPFQRTHSRMPVAIVFATGDHGNLRADMPQEKRRRGTVRTVMTDFQDFCRPKPVSGHFLCFHPRIARKYQRMTITEQLQDQRRFIHAVCRRAVVASRRRGHSNAAIPDFPYISFLQILHLR